MLITHGAGFTICSSGEVPGAEFIVPVVRMLPTTGADDVCDLPHLQLVQAAVVARRFGDNFVCPDAIHQVVKALSTAPQVTFDPQPRLVVRHHAYLPSVPGRRMANTSGGEEASLVSQKGQKPSPLVNGLN